MAEPQIPELGADLPPPRRFRKAGRWLIAEDAKVSDPALIQIFRSNGSRGWVQWLSKWLGGRITVRSHARAIFLKSNLRSFYPPLPVTIKVANPQRPRGSSRIRNEIESRKRLIDAGTIGPPKLLASSSEEPPFLAEELIDALPVQRSGVATREIAHQLLYFHNVNGIEFVPAASVLDIEHDFDLYLSHASRLNIRIPASVASLERSPTISSGLVASALCHGDLTATNLMIGSIGSKKLFITDWEWAERTLVFSDAVRLATQLDGFEACFLDEFGHMSMPAGALDPQTQFLLAAVHVAAKRVARRNEFEQAGALRAYDVRLKDRFLRISRLIERLAASRPSRG